MDAPVPTQLGRYRILGPLDPGKIGVVCHGRDDELNRDVAIKILRDARTSSSERTLRLMSEARAASALSSPNIVAIYDVGTDGDVPYIVSEFIRGETLRQEMNRGPLRVARALLLATQMAEGLAAAHAAGITHGDLKPENVMVTPTGQAKIVDFGLATMVEELATPEASASMNDTHPGLIVGTIPYASPERARGARVDTRSDLFSFGIMLFEMVTGSRPFERTSVVETLDAIVNDDPPDIRTLNPKVPAGLQRVITRCLAKAPADRYGSTTDLALDLRELRDRPADAAPTPVVDPARPSLGQRVGVSAAGGALIGVLAITAWLWSAWRPDRIALSEQTYTPFATEMLFEGKPAWSPNGRTLAYVAEDEGHVLQLFTRSVDSSTAVQVTHARFNCDSPFWSPDGNHIYFREPYGTKTALFEVPASGAGTETRVEDNATAAAIAPDGSALAFFKDESDQGGSLRLWTKWPMDQEARRFDLTPFNANDVSAAALAFSPDSSRLLVWIQHWFAERTAVPYSEFVEVSLKNHTVHQVLTQMPKHLSPQFFSWLPDNRHIVTMTGGDPMPSTHLWIADVDGSLAYQITANNESDGFPSVSRDGRIAFAREDTNFDVMFVPLDGSPLRPVLSSARDEFDPSQSPTRDEFVFATDKAGPLEIDRRVGNEDRPVVVAGDFTDVTRALGSLAFSPNGDRVAYQRLGDDGYRQYISPSEKGSPSRLSKNEGYQDAPTWSPRDDGEVAFMSAGQGKWSLVKGRVGDASVTTLATDVMPYTRPQWSPDGRFIAYQVRSGGLAVIDPARPGSEATLLSNDEWLTFAWNPLDGRLYGLTRSDDRVHFSLTRVQVPANGSHDADVTAVKENLGLVPIANQPIRGFSWNGHGFLTSWANVRSDIWILDGASRVPTFFDLFRPAQPR